MFLVPTLVFYSDTKVRDCDMVKGQAFMTAAYSLGCSCGNFIGGQMLTFSVDAMLLASIITSGLGALILCLTVNVAD